MAADTSNEAANDGNKRPKPLKSRADHTDRPGPSQDDLTFGYPIESMQFISMDVESMHNPPRVMAAAQQMPAAQAGLAPGSALCSDIRHDSERARSEHIPRTIDYYFSLQSPWAYIGHDLFMEVTNHYEITVNFKPVVLVDLFSETGGLPLMKRHPVRQRYRMVELQRWRDKRGLSFHLQPKHWPFNARLADGLIIATIEAGHNPEPLLRRCYAAVWEQHLDLHDSDTLVRLADEAGLPGRQLVAAAASDAIGAIYENNRQDALAADVFGSPVYVLDGEVFWGQDRIELLADALSSGRAAYRANV